MKPILVTPPAEPAVSLAELRAHVRVGAIITEDDSVLQGFISAAVAHLDGYSGILGRCLVAQEWSQGYCGWAAHLLLPFPDVSAATITYLDADGASQTVPSAQYEIVRGHLGDHILFKSAFTWPELDSDAFHPVSVQFTAGYGAAADVPWALKVAIMQLAAHWYENREAVGDARPMPMAFEALMRPYRMAMS